MACPFCGEDIDKGSRRCRHCGEHLVEDRPRTTHTDARLKIGAVLLFLLGALFACLVPFGFLGVMIQSQLPAAQRTDPLQAMIGLGIYVLAAAFCIVTGRGSWLHERWVRPVMLSLSVPGIIAGVIGTIMVGVFMSGMMEATMKMATQQGGGAAPPAGFMSGMIAVTMLFSAVFYIGVPGVFTALYASPKLESICARLDGKDRRWTDGLPIPVVGASIWLGLVSASWLSIPAYNALPFFGRMLTGFPVAIIALLFCVAFGCLAYAVYHRQPLGWLLTMATVALLGLNHVVSFAQLGLLDLYTAMGMPEQQLQIIQEAGLGGTSDGILITGALTCLLVLGYLFAKKDAFTGG